MAATSKSGGSGKKPPALAESMKGFLSKKKAPKPGFAPGPRAKGAPDSPTGKRHQEPEEIADDDPWPEVPLAPLMYGVEDGKKRGNELFSRGDFDGAVRMWGKALHLTKKLPAEAECPSHLRAALHSNRALAFLHLNLWLEAEQACNAALVIDSSLTKALYRRAMARAELGTERSVEAGLQDVRDVLGVYRERALAEGKDDVNASCAEELDQATKLEEKLLQIQEDFVEKLRQAAVLAARPKTTPPPMLAGELPSSSSPSHTPVSSPSNAKKAFGPESREPQLPQELDMAVRQNQVFFERMEQEYAKVCAEDGWDEILGVDTSQYRGPNSLRSLGSQLMPGPDAKGSIAKSYIASHPDQIHEQSDYYRVHIPPSRDRELRPAPEAVLPFAETKPKRNLDDLRAVQEEVKSAIEALTANKDSSLPAARPIGMDPMEWHEMCKKQNRKSQSPPGSLHGSPQGSPTGNSTNGQVADFTGSLDDMDGCEDILTVSTADASTGSVGRKNDVLRIDDLDGEDPGEPSSAEFGSPELGPEEADRQAREMLEALREFDSRRREKEERMAKWRARWGD